jgi:hypothetical protein
MLTLTVLFWGKYHTETGNPKQIQDFIDFEIKSESGNFHGAIPISLEKNGMTFFERGKLTDSDEIFNAVDFGLGLAWE